MPLKEYSVSQCGILASDAAKRLSPYSASASSIMRREYRFSASTHSMYLMNSSAEKKNRRLGIMLRTVRNASSAASTASPRYSSRAVSRMRLHPVSRTRISINVVLPQPLPPQKTVTGDVKSSRVSSAMAGTSNGYPSPPRSFSNERR